MYSIQNISVIITCYKEGELIHRAIKSIENQSIQGFEVLIINDCSPDKLTNQICAELALNPKYNVHFRAKNGGLSAARNSGFELMRGTITVPLDADDELPENAIEDILKTFNDYPTADMVFGNYSIINTNNTEIQEVNSGGIASQQQLSLPLLAKNWILIGTSPCKKDLWERIGGYSSSYTNTVQDVDFWRRAFLKGAKGYFCNTVIYKWHPAENGMNNQVKEEDYLPLRIESLPFYDKFHPEYGIEIRQYIYRYYSSRLMTIELNTFVNQQNKHFTRKQKLKAKLMHIKLLYKIARKAKNLFLK